MSELEAYDFALPEELIAQFPLPDRGDARLLVVHRESGTIEHKHVRDVVHYFNAKDTLVVNNTKVISARLIGSRAKSGGRWEGLFLGFEPEKRWKIICKTRGTLQPGETISLRSPLGEIGFPLILEQKNEDSSWTVRPRTDEDPLTAIEQVGWVPIPPYIRHGRMVDSDKEDYQTIFAETPGAVAAPTAGLHFTEPLLREIREKGLEIHPVTLHVGAGTFRPIATERLEDHIMHSEWGELTEETAQTIQRRRNQGGRTIALGTTSVRVLESAAGKDGTLGAFRGETDLFIRPPYRFKSVDVLFTNFHFPKSTLYVLVRTFGSDALIRRAYEEAIRLRYRFFSYGDAMLIL